MNFNCLICNIKLTRRSLFNGRAFLTLSNQITVVSLPKAAKVDNIKLSFKNLKEFGGASLSINELVAYHKSK